VAFFVANVFFGVGGLSRDEDYIVGSVGTTSGVGMGDIGVLGSEVPIIFVWAKKDFRFGSSKSSVSNNINILSLSSRSSQKESSLLLLFESSWS